MIGIMKRQNLIAFTRDRSRVRLLLGTLAFVLAWLGVLFWKGEEVFDRLGVPYFVAFAAVPIVAMIALAVKMFSEMPKCPHCGVRLVGPLLAAAVASGNCGVCGESIES
jgi:hypothetical protein